MYKLIRSILFLWQPEQIHDFAISTIKLLDKIPVIPNLIRLFYNYRKPVLEREVFGVKFSNPVGLAAGFDKNGDAFNAIANFGFGFVEIGSLTPKEQEGNPKPRCFRLTKDQAIINRMGINNKGIKHAISYIQKHRNSCPIGCSITKGRETPMADAYKDYELCFEYMYDFVDYFVLNVSCPNVEGLTSLQDISYLSDIMDVVLDKRMNMDQYRPILIKISPDIGHAQVDEIVDYALRNGVDGIIACNTTRSREGLQTPAQKVEAIGNGGLSGAPLFEKSLAMVRYLAEKTGGKLPIIGTGGIMTPEQAREMLAAGASLIEVYTGFIYEGPSFPRKILNYLNKHPL